MCESNSVGQLGHVETLIGRQPPRSLPRATPSTGTILNSRNRFLNAVRQKGVDRAPFWFMRQAGRCLPEYRALKERYSFDQLMREPELATEVTLQPVRRFGTDAAILFSDILVVPQAMGQGFTFRSSGGIRMDYRLTSKADIDKLCADGLAESLSYIGTALQMIREELKGQTALIGFAGSPWTLANFMLEGGSSNSFQKAYDLFKTDCESFELLMTKLTTAVADLLKFQIENGADVVQIFDTLGGNLPTEEFEQVSGRWMRDVVQLLHGRAPVIVFSKGCRDWFTLRHIGADAIGIGPEIKIDEAALQLPGIAVQGNFDPSLLVDSTPKQIESVARGMLESMRLRPGYIFNLGHGVPPDAKMQNLLTLVATIKNFA